MQTGRDDRTRSNYTTVSVVIPTYNVKGTVGQTLDCLLKSDTEGFSEVEIIVIDDGSPVPVEPLVAARTVVRPFSVCCLRQKNSGPAAARNAGFRATRGEVVIFIDDDILARPDLIRRHVQAHRARPGSVICGRCPYIEPQPTTPLFRFMDALGYDAGAGVAEEFINMEVVASGQISVERPMFDSERGVYRDDLETPAAEEFELSLRLRERGIPILQATRIAALHDHPMVLESICRQQYKHAVGCAEAAVKYPATLGLGGLEQVIRVNSGGGREASTLEILKRPIKRALATRPTREAMLRAVRIFERQFSPYSLLAFLYRTVIALHFFAGVREGFQIYSANEARE